MALCYVPLVPPKSSLEGRACKAHLETRRVLNSLIVTESPLKTDPPPIFKRILVSGEVKLHVFLDSILAPCLPPTLNCWNHLLIFSFL